MELIQETDIQKVTWIPESIIDELGIPETFNFPFFYEPHPLTRYAAEELMSYLNQNFDFDVTDDSIRGKMFGVMPVEDKNGKIGYISAFSGKLEDSNDHERFVPPVFDMLTEENFFLKGEKIVTEINREIEVIESSDAYKNAKKELNKGIAESEKEIADFKAKIKSNKAARKEIRKNKLPILPPDKAEELENELNRQSNFDNFKFRILKASWKQALEYLQNNLNEFEDTINQLKAERKEKSISLQNQLFEAYSFLNIQGKTRNLKDIFKETYTETPPSGAGECATPKLLQYAFLHNLKPLAFAEFWWGPSPKSEIRQHKNFYPACSGKCSPILKHMLIGIEVEKNPLLEKLPEEEKLKIIFQDDSIVVVNKPAGLLSVPGVELHDSVYTRLQDELKTEPLIVHRLDRATSGLLVVAKTKESHKNLQKQFIERTVDKRYTALIDGNLDVNKGVIRLPIKPDYLDRPRQKVCYESGKKALTHWEKIQENPGQTKINLWPVTGRTHQLRVHCAHPEGLDAPIIGDDLYGKPAKRLCLHASFLEFTHPTTGETMRFEVKEEFKEWQKNE